VKVLVVADEERLIKDTSFFLAMRYPESVIVSTGKGLEGIDMIESETPDLTIVASSLPDTDIFNFISKTREFSNVPLLVLIESKNDIDRAMVLEAGADEYVIQPINPIEFIARVNALLRRTDGGSFKQEQTFSTGELKINFGRREVTLSGKRVKLTPHEYNLLAELARNEGKVVPHHVLLEKVWGSEYIADYTFIKKYICRLRFKLEVDPANPCVILCERGIGYRIVKPVK
jgi:two-component system KDP operon response regulator KdpE